MERAKSAPQIHRFRPKFVVVTLFATLATSYAVRATTPDRALKLENYETPAAMLADLQRIRPDLKLAPKDPAIEAQVDALIVQLDAEYRRLFPALMSNKAFPDYLIVESESVADEATYTSARRSGGDSYRGFIVIPNGPLRDPSQRASLAGIVSHELAHLYLNHRNVDSTVLSLWRASSPGTPADDATRQAVTAYLADAKVAGAYTDQHLAGMPVGDDLLSDVFQKAAETLAKQFPNEPCTKNLSRDAARAFQFLRRDFSYYDWSVHFPTAAEASRVEADLIAFESRTLACSRTLNFKDDHLEFTLMPRAGHWVLATDYLGALFGAGFTLEDRDEFEIIFSAGRAVRERMRSTWAKFNLADVRWRSYEDEADEFAQTILKSLKLSPTDFVNSLLDVFEPREPGLIGRCFTAIGRKQEVPFGDLSDPHHGICYRIQTVHRHAEDPNFTARP